MTDPSPSGADTSGSAASHEQPGVIPVALLGEEKRRPLMGALIWIVPLIALGASVLFTWFGTREHGPTIVIHAAHGHGVGEGDSVRYLGIDVGVVREVTLGHGDDESAVSLQVQLSKDAGDLARAGTQFWVVRPQLSLDSIEGLETIIGSRYIALFPGPKDAERRTQFTALSEPPLADEIRGGLGLEIVLEAPTRFGIQPGAGLTYRGVRIGTIIGVGLASDATSVEVRVRIRSSYAQLVRDNSMFWETGGFEFGLSLTGGLNIDLDSLRTALIGGVAMATPTNSGAVVSTGTRFRLHANVDEEWLDWTPPLPLGNELLPAGVSVPELLRATLTWTEGRILKTQSSVVGWMHATPMGLRGPRDLLLVPEDARDGSAVLSVAGRSFDLGGLAEGEHMELMDGAATGLLRPALFMEAWPGLLSSSRAAQSREVPPRPLGEAEDLIVCRDTGRDPLGIDSSRLRLEGDVILVDSRIAISPDWHGALVLARSDGAVVGIVIVEEDDVSIRLLP